jgi:type IV pilus assembly protein PilC
MRAGLSAKEAFKMSAERGSPIIRELSAKTLEQLENGESVASALKKIPFKVPALFLAMAQVGGKTGNFPEILRELESYYRFQLTLRRQFIQRITLPVIQLFAAIFVIALMILLLGMLATGPSGKPAFDPLGFGLFGPTGALIWLALSFGTLAGLGALYWAARKLWGMSETIDRILMRVPALGPCLEALAMARLTLAMRMTMDSSLPLRKTIPLCLDATDNGVYQSQAHRIVEDIHDKGQAIHRAFENTGVFPTEFLHVLATAEEAGSVPEEMGRMSEHYNEVAQHRLVLLNQALGWMVWSLVAALITFLIFRMALSYIGMLNNAIEKPLG